MNQPAMSTIIPGMRYADAPAAIEWLCRAFGFSRHLVVPDDQGGIAHARLVLGNGMIMLGSAREGSEHDEVVKLPRDVGANTQSAYIVIQEIEEHYRRAVAEGAAIVYELSSQDYGGQLYSACDPEGHLWNFGSYDPWADQGDRAISG